MSNLVKVWDETLPLFNNTEMKQEEIELKDREFLQGEYLPEAEST